MPIGNRKYGSLGLDPEAPPFKKVMSCCEAQRARRSSSALLVLTTRPCKLRASALRELAGGFEARDMSEAVRNAKDESQVLLRY
jgi:hypothetical protein